MTLIARARQQLQDRLRAEVADLPRDSRLALAGMLFSLRTFALMNADESRRRSKWMMFAYWKVVAVYAGHFRRVALRGMR